MGSPDTFIYLVPKSAMDCILRGALDITDPTDEQQWAAYMATAFPGICDRDGQISSAISGRFIDQTVRFLIADAFRSIYIDSGMIYASWEPEMGKVIDEPFDLRATLVSCARNPEETEQAKLLWKLLLEHECAQENPYRAGYPDLFQRQTDCYDSLLVPEEVEKLCKACAEDGVILRSYNALPTGLGTFEKDELKKIMDMLMALRGQSTYLYAQAFAT